jgi:hypothetical protein
MKLGALKSVGHNVADSLASGICLMIGIHNTNVFVEAQDEAEGFIVVDFLSGEVKSAKASESLRQAARLYRDGLPAFCERHGIDFKELRMLEGRFGTDAVYGRHFTVTIEDALGRKSSDRYVGQPGRRLRERK